MNIFNKKRFILFLIVLFFANSFIGLFLIKNRFFQHIAVWKIKESDKIQDFNWSPENAPSYFNFEPDSEELNFFKEDLKEYFINEKDGFEISLIVARHIDSIRSKSGSSFNMLRWDSPLGMLHQVKSGAGSNCFHKSILFSTYLASLGIKSRLWTMENKGLDNISHTIAEVYSKRLEKWIFFDVHLDFYATTPDKTPLSFLELRRSLLKANKNNKFNLFNIENIVGKSAQIPDFYKKLVACSFLRASNDFINKYDSKIRYGIFSIFQKRIDSLPDKIRRGLDYSLGRRDIFIHYVDNASRWLTFEIIAAKVALYFFIASVLFFGFLLLVSFLIFLKKSFH